MCARVSKPFATAWISAVVERSADVVVIGAGPGGIAAAATAAESGCSVILLDEGARVGGQIWRHHARTTLPRAARVWLARLDRSSVCVLPRATVFDARAAPLYVDVEQDERHLRVHASRALIIATGARELFLPFPGWTLPGVVGVGAAQALMKAGVNVRGQRVIVAGTGPLLLPVAALAARSGAHVVLVGEQAQRRAVRRFVLSLWRSPARVAAAVRYRAAFASAPYRTDTWVVRARGTRHVEEAVISVGSTTRTVRCDLLCVGYGLTAATELARLLGCATSGNAVIVDDRQRTTLPGVYCVGESTGIAGAEAALLEGTLAALTVVDRTPPRPLLQRVRAQHQFARMMEAAFALRHELRALADADTTVCRCEDVTFAAVARHDNARDAKLQTRAGMGSCQGRVCGPALRHLFGWEHDTVRPPLVPAGVAALADTHSGDIDAQK